MIRVSTNMIYDQGVFNMQNRSSAMLKTQDQVANGRRMLTPADDPVAAARSLEVEQAKAITEQHSRNSDSAISALGMSDSTLASVTSLLQSAKTLTVNAGDGALTPTDLQSLGLELQARYQELLGLANSTDGNGTYLYSGYQGSTIPFSETAPGVVAYRGDQGQRLVQIAPSRQVAISDAGSDVFQLIKNGNGTFAAAAAGANTGTGIVSPGNVTDAAAWNNAANPQDFTVKFFVNTTVNPNVTTYDIVDKRQRQFFADRRGGRRRSVPAHVLGWRRYSAQDSGSAGYQCGPVRLWRRDFDQGRSRQWRHVHDQSEHERRRVHHAQQSHHGSQ